MLTLNLAVVGSLNLVGPVVFALLMAASNWVILKLAEMPMLVIDQTGMKFGEVGKLPWERVEACRWGLHAPYILIIKTSSHKKPFSIIDIPEGYGVQVEAALRRFGKWQD